MGQHLVGAGPQRPMVLSTNDRSRDTLAEEPILQVVVVTQLASAPASRFRASLYGPRLCGASDGTKYWDPLVGRMVGHVKVAWSLTALLSTRGEQPPLDFVSCYLPAELVGGFFGPALEQLAVASVGRGGPSAGAGQ